MKALSMDIAKKLKKQNDEMFAQGRPPGKSFMESVESMPDPDIEIVRKDHPGSEWVDITIRMSARVRKDYEQEFIRTYGATR